MCYWKSLHEEEEKLRKSLETQYEKIVTLNKEDSSSSESESESDKSEMETEEKIEEQKMEEN